MADRFVPGAAPGCRDPNIKSNAHVRTRGTEYLSKAPVVSRLIVLLGAKWMAAPAHQESKPVLERDGITMAADPTQTISFGGQNQEEFLDNRDHSVDCWQNYTTTGGPNVCIQFAVPVKATASSRTTPPALPSSLISTSGQHGHRRSVNGFHSL